MACGFVLTENHGSIKIWDVSGGRLVHTLAGHSKVVWGVAYSPDGQRIASGSFDQKVKIWDANTGQEALTLHGHTNTVPGVAFSPDGQRLASASEDGTIRIWDASPITVPPPRELLTIGGHTDEVRAVAFSPDGRWLASAGDDMTAQSGRQRAAECVHVFREHTHPVYALAFRFDSRRIVSGDHGGSVRIWDRATGSVVSGPRFDENPAVFGIAYSPDGRYVSTDYGLRDATTGNLVSEFPEVGWMTFCVAYSHDGRHVATGSRDGAVGVYEPLTGRMITTVSQKTGRTSAVAFSPDDRYLAAAGVDGSLRLWETHPMGGPRHDPRAQRARPRSGIQPRWPTMCLRGCRSDDQGLGPRIAPDNF